MARPIKDGVDYFPKDTTFYSDDKVRLLRAEFGAKGMYLLDYILCEIYGKNGYFMQWDRCRCYLVSDGAGCGCDPQFVEEFVAGCVRCSFFDKRVFDLFGVLTSSGIQRRYVRMFNGRDEIAMKEDYFLLDTSSKKDVPVSSLNKLRLISNKSTENPDKSTENPDKSTENQQSKVKKSKVKENKGKETVCAETETASAPKPLFPILLNDGSLFGFTKEQIAEWEELYPSVDVKQAMRNMQAWCKANPARRKAKKGILRFVTNWLVSDQNSGRNKRRQNTANTYGGADDFCALMEDGNDENGE